MTKFITPIDFTVESLSEHGYSDLTLITVPANEIEFLDKNSLKINGMSYSIFKDGIKEFCSLIGISSVSIQKFPEDLFAYIMNYFYRRAEDIYVDVYVNKDFTVESVQMAGTFRLSIEDIINLVTETYSDRLLISAFSKKARGVSITLLTERFENEPNTTAFPALTLSFDDRLLYGISYYLGIDFWGGLAKDQSPYLTTSISKKESVEVLMRRIAEDLALSFKTLKQWAPMVCESAKDTIIENPHNVVGKVLTEHGLGKSKDKLLKLASISDTINDAYHLAKEIADLSVDDRVNARQSAKLETTAGYMLQQLQQEHRCIHCKTLIDNG